MTTRRKDVFAAAAAAAVRAGIAATEEAPAEPAIDETPAADAADSEPESAPDEGYESQQDLSATDGATPATGRQARAHNKHDVGALEQECNQLTAAIAQRGAQLDVATIQQRAQSYAAMKLLVDHHICTEAEAQAAVLTEIRNMLASILQQVEVQRLQQARQQGAAGPQVQAVRKPDLILPTSHTMRRQQQD